MFFSSIVRSENAQTDSFGLKRRRGHPALFDELAVFQVGEDMSASRHAASSLDVESLNLVPCVPCLPCLAWLQ